MKIQVAIPALVVSLGSLASADVIDPALEAVLRTTPPDSTVSTLVYLAEQTDLAGLTGALDDQRVHRRGRHEAVVRALQDLAADRQAPIVAALDDLVRAGGVQSYQPLWVTNSLRVDGRPGAIVALAQRPDVQRIFFNHPIEGVRPVSEGDGGDQGGGAAGADPEPGLVAIRAPEVWNDLGITGAGVLVSTLDTGVDGGHPALASRWRGLDPAYKDNPGWAFFDPVTGWTFPQDSGSHGTHTMGTVCGGAPGDPVGVAPGAEWIHAAVIDRVNVETTVADAQLAFQWVIDPDGDPGTVFDVPVVNSNSWGLADFHGYPDCDELFWSFLDAAEAAGVLIVFAAGNESFSGLRRPADRATDEYRTLAVAALNGNVPGFPIAGFSSRGPTFCTPDGSAAIKPDIAAPGDDVRSAFPGGGYNDSSGTSMAAPHICGVVALMREANPDATVQEIKQIIYDHAMDLGAPGDDNDFGHGIVDALEAVQAAIDLIQVTFSFPGGLPDLVDPDGGASLLVNIEPGQSAPDPKTAMLHVSTGGDFAAIPMLETEPGVYAAVFPEFECGDQVQFYFSVETMDGDLALNPSGAPEQVYTAGAYTFIGPVFADDFETDTGWSVEDDDTITDGAWDRGVPAGGGDRGDPPTDGDGSGQCYLTDNEDGNSDVDGGTTILTSPVMDASFGDPVIAYRRWYSNVEGNATHQDVMIVEVSDDAGASWVELETVGPDGEEVAGGWFDASFPVAGAVALTDEFRVRFVVGDAEPESIIEAAVDGVQLIRGFCENDRCPADVDGSGEVDVDDLVLVILSWGPCPGCPADVNDDGEVDVGDLVDVVLGWGGCE